MPAITPLIINDGTDNETLTPDGRGLTDQRYRSGAAGTPAANVSLLYSKKESNAGVQRQYVRLNVPVVAVDSITGEEYVRENIIAELTLRVPNVAPSTDRAKAVALFYSTIWASALEAELMTGEGQW